MVTKAIESVARLRHEASKRGLLGKDGTFEILDLLVALFDELDALRNQRRSSHGD